MSSIPGHTILIVQAGIRLTVRDALEVFPDGTINESLDLDPIALV